ncbi:MAG: hypothetical protein IJM96_03170 [Clostridia bacterium]|nr:hypothetical protein [Clostridia bacterium]
MSTTITTREYRASVIVYADDVQDLYDVQYEIARFISGTSSGTNISPLFSALSFAAKNVLKLQWLSSSAKCLSYLSKIAAALDARTKESILQTAYDGTYGIGELSFYFDDHPNYEAIQTTLSFMDIIDNSTNETFRIIVNGNSEVECEKILVNGVWLEP